MTETDNSDHSWLQPIKIGTVVGLFGGALIGLVESIGALLTILGEILPSSPDISEALALVAGLTFLAALYAIGGALGLAILGGLATLWQTMRRVTIAPRRLVALSGAILAFLYTFLLAVDRLDISRASGGSALVWGLVLFGQAAVVGCAAWFLFNILAEGWQQDRRGWLRPLRWSTARNLAGGLLAILLILPLAPAGLHALSQSKVPARSVARAATEATSADRPNIILITIDALRADHLGAYGYEEANTPNIDAFAAEGVLFEQAISQAPWTFPSFASMFTSMYPAELDLSVDNQHVLAMYARSVDDARVTLAEALREAGYRTQAIVTNPWLKPEHGFAQGFEGFMNVDETRIYHIHKLNEMSLLRALSRVPRAYQAVETTYTLITGNPIESLWDVRADRVTEEAVDWLRHNQDAPFFLWVHYIDPHYPFDPPEGYRPGADAVTAERLAYLSSYNEDDIYTGRARLRPEDMVALVELYDGEIAYNDVYFGQLLDEIDVLGLRDNTVVVFSADHGDEFWEHGGYQHGHSLYDELIHIPLVIRGPGILAEPRRITADVKHLDLMPTLLDLIGRDAPAEAQGRSLLPMLRGDTFADDKVTFNFAEALFLTEEKKAIRGGGFKLIYSPFSNQFELYDLIRDPGEQYSLTEADPAQGKELYVLLEEWLSAAEARTRGLSLSHTRGGADPSTIYDLLDGEN